MKVIPETRRA